MQDAEERCRQAQRADAVARMALLSPREREVLERAAAGYNKVVAAELGISLSTVEIHRAGDGETAGRIARPDPPAGTAKRRQLAAGLTPCSKACSAARASGDASCAMKYPPSRSTVRG